MVEIAGKKTGILLEVIFGVVRANLRTHRCVLVNDPGMYVAIFNCNEI